MLKSFICMSASTENFLKTIYSFRKLEARDTKPGSIAKALGISNAAATDMAKKLSVRKLVLYEKYQPLNLTNEGEKIALQILRKHRLWETFLHKTFGMSLLEIHREAELLEHQTSDFMADKLWEYLGKPDCDPHGDPIPDVEGKVHLHKDNQVLYKADVNVLFEIKRLINRDEEFFQFCKGNGIEIGTKLQVVKQYSKNKLTEILIREQKILIPQEFSGLVYVRQISEQ